MTFKLSPHDEAVAKSFKMVIRTDAPFADPRTVGKLGGILGVPFPFQFPPRITADSKGATWDEQDRISYEPLAFYMGSTARKLNIEAQYAAVNSQWSGSKIAKIAHAAKAYFYRSITAVYPNSGGYGPIVDIYSAYGAIESKSTWRLTEVTVEYGPEIIGEAQRESIYKMSPYWARELEDWEDPVTIPTGEIKYFPLKTKLSFSCASYTKIQDGDNDKSAVNVIKALERFPIVEWY